MEIRNDMDGLKSLLGISQAAPNQVQAGKGAGVRDAGPLSADTATLSSAGSVVAQDAADGGVRMDKVAAVQAALAAGTYSVPSSAVASRVVDAMLGAGR
jgi:flagellar biosynthesis anti-sigma factor FlgM